MSTYLTYRTKVEDHPKHNDVKVHTFQFSSEAERDAFEAGVNFIQDGNVATAAVGLPEKGGVVPGLVVTVMVDR
jgi:hypothetical protein